MKKANTNIKGVFISKPCHANWDTMNETEKGRYCNACSKIVYDFTNANPTEFFRLYRENNGNVCGNFYAAPTFWGNLKVNASILAANTKVAAVSFFLGLGILTYKGASGQSCPPNGYKLIENSTTTDTTGFVTIAIELRKEGENKLLEEEYSVEIILKDYTAKLNKVTNGIALIQIPTELLNTDAKIIIRNNSKYPIYADKHFITAQGLKIEVDKKIKIIRRHVMGAPSF